MEKIVERHVATAVIRSACDWLVVATELPRGGLVHQEITGSNGLFASDLHYHKPRR